MSKSKKVRLALASAAGVVVLLAGIGVAVAQNYSLNPAYGSRSLRPGFMPDPVTVSLTAGGNVNTRTSGPAPACGYVAQAPDFRLNWSGGGGTLNIYAVAGAYTTLLINMPNASWRCNDDGGAGNNPLITLSGAPAGQYDIWVGTYGSSTAPAVLKISELSPQW